MVFVGMGQQPDLVQPIAVQSSIFRMNVHQPVAEFPQWLEVVHLLPDAVRRIEVQAEVQAGNVGEHPPPDRRADGEVLAAGPFIPGEKHRAILNANPHPGPLGSLDQRPPGGQKPGPVVVDR